MNPSDIDKELDKLFTDIQYINIEESYTNNTQQIIRIIIEYFNNK